uniref:CD109 antigen n=1 Tax=Ceratitis capitata TaxID=7213 RepID=W8BAX1_CERCA
MFKLAVWLPILGLIISIAAQAQAEGYYTVTAPGTIRPNSKYSVYVSVSDISVDAQIVLSLQGPKYQKYTELIIPPNSGQNVTFEIRDIPRVAYSLQVQGLSGIIFENYVNLEFADNPPAVYIQTDKATYRQGDTIQFRAIFLDQYLLPAKVNQPISVLIKNPQSFISERFDDVTLDVGVFKTSSRIPNYVSTGEWSIEVCLGNDVLKNKVINVIDTSPPPFDMDLDVPRFVCFRDIELVVTVRARYSHKQPITGRCLITITPQGRQPQRRNESLTNGIKEITIPIRRLGRNVKSVLIHARIEDYFNPISYSVSKTVQIVPNLYVIETPSITYECFQPDDVFLYSAHIHNLNGDPIDVDDDVIVHFETTFNAWKNVTNVDDNGYVNLHINCSNLNAINLTIRYEGMKSVGVISFKQWSDIGKEGLYVTTKNPKVGDSMDMRLISTQYFTSFACVIVGRGNIVYNNMVSIPNGGGVKAHTFSIIPTYEMLPEAHIFVYFFKNGKLIYYESTFKVENQFQNTITIESPVNIKPGTFVSFNVDTEANSFIGLLGMELDAFMLKPQNDLNAIEIFDGLLNAKSRTPAAYVNPKSPYPGENAGLVTMTNADYISGFKAIAKEKRLSSKPLLPHTYFENLVFADIVSVDGHEEMMAKIPYSYKSWAITGFAISPKTGFTLARPKVIKTLKGLHVDIELPYYVKRKSLTKLQVVVSNYLNADTKINVSMESENGEYEFIKGSGNSKYTIRTDVIRPGKSKTLYFRIHPNVSGLVKVKVTAKNPIASAVCVKKMRVEK